MESIDFSMNQLSGQIPSSMSSLTFLNHLNLSNNNLTGKIPLSTQLQSFNASDFIGNKLCGLPLSNNCTINDVNLGCTDAAPRPVHPRLTWRDAATREGRRKPRVRAASCHVAVPESG